MIEYRSEDTIFPRNCLNKLENGEVRGAAGSHWPIWSVAEAVCLPAVAATLVCWGPQPPLRLHRSHQPQVYSHSHGEIW